tara:strand:+ start:715 stop:1002 length:288 start_codon:yes stop_codon:yes gene_type:complete
MSSRRPQQSVAIGRWFSNKSKANEIAELRATIKRQQDTIEAQRAEIERLKAEVGKKKSNEKENDSDGGHDSDIGGDLEWKGQYPKYGYFHKESLV